MGQRVRRSTAPCSPRASPSPRTSRHLHRVAGGLWRGCQGDHREDHPRSPGVTVKVEGHARVDLRGHRGRPRPPQSRPALRPDDLGAHRQLRPSERVPAHDDGLGSAQERQAEAREGDLEAREQVLALVGVPRVGVTKSSDLAWTMARPAEGGWADRSGRGHEAQVPRCFDGQRDTASVKRATLPRRRRPRPCFALAVRPR